MHNTIMFGPTGYQTCTQPIIGPTGYHTCGLVGPTGYYTCTQPQAAAAPQGVGPTGYYTCGLDGPTGYFTCTQPQAGTAPQGLPPTTINTLQMNTWAGSGCAQPQGILPTAVSDDFSIGGFFHHVGEAAKKTWGYVKKGGEYVTRHPQQFTLTVACNTTANCVHNHEEDDVVMAAPQGLPPTPHGIGPIATAPEYCIQTYGAHCPTTLNCYTPAHNAQPALKTYIPTTPHCPPLTPATHTVQAAPQGLTPTYHVGAGTTATVCTQVPDVCPPQGTVYKAAPGGQAPHTVLCNPTAVTLCTEIYPHCPPNATAAQAAPQGVHPTRTAHGTFATVCTQFEPNCPNTRIPYVNTTEFPPHHGGGGTFATVCTQVGTDCNTGIVNTTEYRRHGTYATVCTQFEPQCPNQQTTHTTVTAQAAPQGVQPTLYGGGTAATICTQYGPGCAPIVNTLQQPPQAQVQPHTYPICNVTHPPFCVPTLKTIC